MLHRSAFCSPVCRRSLRLPVPLSSLQQSSRRNVVNTQAKLQKVRPEFKLQGLPSCHPCLTLHADCLHLDGHLLPVYTGMLAPSYTGMLAPSLRLQEWRPPGPSPSLPIPPKCKSRSLCLKRHAAVMSRWSCTRGASAWPWTVKRCWRAAWLMSARFGWMVSEWAYAGFMLVYF